MMNKYSNVPFGTGILVTANHACKARTSAHYAMWVIAFDAVIYYIIL